MSKVTERTNHHNEDQEDLAALMDKVMSGSGAVVEDPPDLAKIAEPVPVQDTAADALDAKSSGVTDLVPSTEPVWQRKGLTALKTTVVKCIVIDKRDHWYQDALVDLKGIDASSFTWGYYGQRLPVLVESADQAGVLMPWFLPDAAGESSNRLFKAAFPDGFRATFKHKASTLQKIQIGLMIALVFGLFFIMYILINQ